MCVTMKRPEHGPLRSVYYAVRGLGFALFNERNLRVHFAAAAYVLWFSRYYSLGRVEYALLIMTIGIVIAAEMINTAIEKSIDVTVEDFNALAGSAKDVAAGAVLVASLTSFGVGVALFWEPAVFLVIWEDIIKAPLLHLFFVILTIIWIAPLGSLRKR